MVAALQQAACSCTVDPRALLQPRVLLIDGNFSTPTVSAMLAANYASERLTW
jgi:hypothetical protein